MTEENNNQSSLPKGWILTRLGEIGNVAAGGTPSTNDPNNFDGDIPWITPADLSDFKGKLIEHGRRNLSQKGLNSSSAVLLPVGTVLFSSRAPIGYVAIAANPISTNQGFKNLSCYEGIFNEYVFYYLKASKRLAETYGSGTTFKEVSASRFAKIPIPLCPTNEQRRIVSRVEELLPVLDAGVESLRKVKSQLKRYRQAVLKYAFEGKLTEEWRKTHKNQIEPAQKLLERIKQERKKIEGTKYKEWPQIETTSLPELPEGWVWTRLGQIISVHSGEGLTKHQMDPNVEYPVYGGNGITGYYSKYMFEESRVIIGRVGAKCGAVHITLPRSWVTDNALVTDSWQVDLRFLFYALHNLNLNRFSVSTAQPVISSTKIYPLLFKLPPLLEQTKIVEEIERRLSVSDEIEKIMEQGLKQSERLRQSILKMAFEGKLVPQDPSDEPAERLLERIKEERGKLRNNKNIKVRQRESTPKQMELMRYV